MSSATGRRTPIEAPPIKILLLEDSEEDFQDLEAMLGRMRGVCYTLDWAQDFDDGLAALKEKEYDVCLVDSSLGPRGGLEFLREAKAQGVDAPIIMLSEGGRADHDVAALRAGAADYLLKGKIHPIFLQRAITYALERRRAQGEADELEKRLIHAQRIESFGHLASSLAQDLGNVLGGIIGHLDLIRMRAGGDGEIARSAETALEGCRRAAFLADQLRACSSRDSSSFSSVNLQQIVLETVDFLTRILPKNISLTTEVDRSDELTINGDPALIRQALVNLTVNAEEALPEGGIIHYKISADFIDAPPRVVAEAHPGRYARVDIRDTGRGIPDDDLEHIFEPTFTTKRGGKRMGLGLPAVFSIMSRHHGWVAVDSKFGKGCVFSLFFPLANRVLEYMHDGPRRRLITKGLVVAIEDEATLAELMKLYLEAAGYTAKVFTSPGEAIAWYSSHTKEVDLVLLDMVMPDISGKECFEIIRKINPEAKIAVFAGHMDRDVQELLKQGAVKFFQKPASYPLIITWVAEVLGKA